MKRSHYTTPRTMNESTWQPWGAAVERPYPRTRFAGRTVFLGVLALAVWSFVWIVLTQ